MGLFPITQTFPYPYLNKSMIYITYTVRCPCLKEEEICYALDEAQDICYALYEASEGGYAWAENSFGEVVIEYGKKSGECFLGI